MVDEVMNLLLAKRALVAGKATQHHQHEAMPPYLFGHLNGLPCGRRKREIRCLCANGRSLRNQGCAEQRGRHNGDTSEAADSRKTIGMHQWALLRRCP